MRENKIKRMISEGKQVFGTFVGLPAPGIVEICGDAGLDFVILDMEHGTFSFETVENLVRAADLFGMTSIIRVPEGRPKVILRALETGAQAIMVPQVGDAETARIIGDATRYGPRGHRGVANHTRGGGYAAGALVEHMEYSNSQVQAIVQIESPEGVDHVEAIAAAENVDMIYVGPVDLSSSYGLPLQVKHPTVQGAIEKALNAAKKAKKATGIFCVKLEDAIDAGKRGIDLVTWSTDTLLLNRGIRDGLKEWREKV